MGTINVSQVVGMVDKVTAWYVTVRGSATSGEGMGTAGSSYGGNDKATELEALGLPRRTTTSSPFWALPSEAFATTRTSTPSPRRICHRA